MSLRRFGLIGAGRVGLALARHAMGRGYTLSWAIDSRPVSPEGLDASLAAKLRRCTSDITSSPVDLCIIAVVDDAIGVVAEELAASTALSADALVFHTSGMRTSADLLALAAVGMHAGSIHPIQSFADPLGFTDTAGIGCGIEGTDAFCERAFALAASFGWKPLRIDAERKALYHAACVFAGNFPTVLAAHADELLRSASGGADASTLPMLLPMMETVIARLHEASPADALTGPAARGQAEVVREHLSLLSTRHPTLAASYRALSESAAMMAASDNATLIKPRQTDHDPTPRRSRNPGDDDEV